MKFFLWLKQKGEGCDYTIGCGSKLFELKGDTPGRAVVEASQIIRDYTHDESFLDKALVLTATEDLSHIIQIADAELKAAKADQERAKKRQELERLKRELGE